MKKPFKILLLGIAALLVLLLAAVVVLSMVVDPNDFKPQIAELVEKNTGFKIEFNGPLELKVFPRLALSAKNVAVAADPDYGEAPLLDLDEASLRMALLPLLGGRLEVDSLLLSGAKVSLLTDARGRNNWEPLSGREAAAESRPAASKNEEPGAKEDPGAAEGKNADPGRTDQKGESGGSRFSGQISSVTVEKCLLNYKNQGSGQDVSLLVNSLQLENISPGQDMSLTLDAVLNDKASSSTASARLGGKAKLDPEPVRVSLEFSRLSLTVKSAQVPEPQTFEGSFKADLGLRDFAGELALALNNPNLDLQAVAKSAGLAAGSGALPRVDGVLSLRAKPAELFAVLGLELETAGSQALKAFNLEAPFSLGAANKNELLLSDFKGNLDATSISGSLKARLPGAPGLPAGVDYSADAVLALGEINLDDYLPPESRTPGEKLQARAGGQGPAAGQVAGQAAGQAAGTTKGPLKDTPLEKAALSFNLSLNQATIKKISIQDLSAGLSLDRGTASLEALSLKTLGGSVKGRARANLLQASPAVSASASAAGLDLETAMKALADSDKLSGRADLDLNLNFSGLDYPAISKTLGGNGKFSVSGGKIQQFQLIPADSPAALLRYRQEDYPFDEAGASFSAAGGVIRNSDLLLKSPKLVVSGAGTVDLGKNNIDYRARITLPKEKGEPSIPVRIQGSLDAVKCGPDLEEIARTAGRDAARSVLQNLQNKGKIPSADKDSNPDETPGKDAQKGQKIEEGVRNLLKGLKK